MTAAWSTGWRVTLLNTSTKSTDGLLGISSSSPMTRVSMATLWVP